MKIEIPKNARSINALATPQEMRAFYVGNGGKPILGRHNIFYWPFTGVTDHARFVRVFRETWRMIPRWARCLLTAEWRLYPLVPPLVHVTTIWKEHNGKTFGSWNAQHQFHFWSKAVNSMSDEVLSILIAHELAHPVHLLVQRQQEPELFVPGYLMLKPEFRIPENERHLYVDFEEFDVRELQDMWGFSEEKLCEWEDANSDRLLAEHQAEMEALSCNE